MNEFDRVAETSKAFLESALVYIEGGGSIEAVKKAAKAHTIPKHDFVVTYNIAAIYAAAFAYATKHAEEVKRYLDFDKIKRANQVLLLISRYESELIDVQIRSILNDLNSRRLEGVTEIRLHFSPDNHEGDIPKWKFFTHADRKLTDVGGRSTIESFWYAEATLSSAVAKIESVCCVPKY